MSKPIPFGLHGMTDAFLAEVSQELDQMLAQEAILTELEQIELAQLYRDRPPQRAVDGVGDQILAISRTAFIHFKAVEQLDFSSKKDLRWLVQRHPHMKAPRRVNASSTVGYSGPVSSGQVSSVQPGPERNVRETTSYPIAA